MHIEWYRIIFLRLSTFVYLVFTINACDMFISFIHSQRRLNLFLFFIHFSSIFLFETTSNHHRCFADIFEFIFLGFFENNKCKSIYHCMNIERFIGCCFFSSKKSIFAFDIHWHFMQTATVCSVQFTSMPNVLTHVFWSQCISTKLNT